MLNGELCSCFLPQRPVISYVSLTNSGVERRDLHASWIRACLITLVSFLLSLALFPAVLLLPSLCAVESRGVGGLQSWDIITEGWGTWPVLLLCFSHCTHSCSSIPICIVALTRISLGFSPPLSLLCCAAPSDSEGNLLAAE